MCSHAESRFINEPPFTDVRQASSRGLRRLDQLPERETAESETASIRHAALMGLLYRTLATELREPVSGPEYLEQFMNRYLAVSPQNIDVDDEDVPAQALFDPSWAR
jgi:hypothetical protein